MTPHYKPTFGDWNTFTSDENFPELDTYDSGVGDMANLQHLQASPVIKGDHKSPNAHKYDARVYTCSGLSRTDRVIGLQRAGSRKTGYHPELSILRNTVSDFSAGYGDYQVTYDKALDELLESVRGGLDLAVDLSQSKQAVQLFKSMTNLRGLVVSQWKILTGNSQFFHYKPGRIGVRLTREQRYVRTRELSSRWLEFQYGLRPAMSTIHGLAEELAGNLWKTSQVFKGNCTRKWEGRENASSFMYPGMTGNSYLTQSATHKVRFAVRMTTQPFELNRLTSLNPLSLIWENIPYSFVADWAVDIGGYLRSCETSVLYRDRVESGYVSRLMISNNSITDTVSSSQYGTYTSSYATANFRRVFFERTPIYTLPFPDRPKLDVNLGASRLLNAAALIGVQTKRFRF